MKGFEVNSGEELPAAFKQMSEFKTDALIQGAGDLSGETTVEQSSN